MKRVLFFCIIVFLFHNSAGAQSQGINTRIAANADGSYTVTITNFNPCQSITWFLSYRGRRVSDSFTTFARGRRYESVFLIPGETVHVTVRAWPNEVPRWHERYVTVQLGLGRERNRRDDG